MSDQDDAVDTAAQRDLTGSASVLGDAVQPGDLAADPSPDEGGRAPAPGGAPTAGDELGPAATDPDQPGAQGP